MISRRILRTKVLQTVYSYFMRSEDDYKKAESDLFYSIEKSYDLYFYLILLGINTIELATKNIETSKKSLSPQNRQTCPNYKFVNNKIISQLRDNESFNSHLKKHSFTWQTYPELLRRLLNELYISQEYKDYMQNSHSNYDDDKRILIFFYEQIVCECSLLYQILEEISIYWIDSVEFIISMVIRSISRYKFSYDKNHILQKIYKNDSDREFVSKLLSNTVLHHFEYKKLIAEHIHNWDIDRLAFIDTIIMEIALSEIVCFPEIPIKVTFNEYIEIAKNYSTTKSCVFINGVLDKMIQNLIELGKINRIIDTSNIKRGKNYV